jgi:glycosyltransferase involved in cell wall biosynthesis
MAGSDYVNGLVSVVLPTYNRGYVLAKAIESALGQTYRPVEVIVVDDGSEDNTPEVAERYAGRIRYLRQRNCGAAVARNRAIAAARGEYIAFLDSDDRWMEWKLEAEVALLHAQPDAGLVWTDMTAIDEQDQIVADRFLTTYYETYREVSLIDFMEQVGTLRCFWPNAPAEIADAKCLKGDLSSAIFLGNLLHTPTVLVRRSWLDRSGPFDTRYRRGGEDYELYTRLCSLGPVIYLDVPSIWYRAESADRLTAHTGALEFARADVKTISEWLAERPGTIKLPWYKIRRRVGSAYRWLGRELLRWGQYEAARDGLFKAVWSWPFACRSWSLLVLSLMPWLYRSLSSWLAFLKCRQASALR